MVLLYGHKLTTYVEDKHDSGLNTNKHGKGAQLVQTGVNVDRSQFSNPASLTMEAFTAGQRKPIHNSIEVGLEEMRRLMKLGKLKISKRCPAWHSEKNGYFYTGKKGEKAYAGAEHSIDASRYGILSLVGNKGTPFGQCQLAYNDFNNGFDGDDGGIEFEY